MPARARRYRPLGSRSSHTSSGVSTYTSTNGRSVLGVPAPDARRGARRTARRARRSRRARRRPASARPRRRGGRSRRASRRRTRGRRTARGAGCRRRSGTRRGRRRPAAPRARRRSPTCRRTGSPVSQIVAPCWPSAAQRSSRVAAPRSHTTFGLRVPPSCDRLDDHAGGDGGVGRLVDQDEAAGRAVVGVAVDGQRRRGAQRDPADVVELERRRGRARCAGCRRRRGARSASAPRASCGSCA